MLGAVVVEVVLVLASSNEKLVLASGGCIRSSYEQIQSKLVAIVLATCC